MLARVVHCTHSRNKKKERKGNRKRVFCYMQDSIRSEDTERRAERLKFLRVLVERELPIPVYEVGLEIDACTSQFGKHGIRMMHRPHMLLGLKRSLCEIEI